MLQYRHYERPVMTITSLFITSAQNNAGSIIITMSLMQLLTSKIPRVGFFRPIVNGNPSLDPDIRFIKEYFRLPQSYEESYGMELSHFETLLAEGKLYEAYAQIIDRYEQLKRQNDFMLIEGVSPKYLVPPMLGDLNTQLARNLDASVITVVNAKEKTAQEILNEIHIQCDLHKTHSLTGFMTIVNRIAPHQMSEIQKTCQGHHSIYFTPEIDELNTITIRDIVEGVPCQVVYGDGRDLERSISERLVGAMNSDHYLSRLIEKSLIIVPGDRSDIITATLLGLYSKNCPNVAGIVLTGALKLSQQVSRLLEGLDMPTLPILISPWDTYRTITLINEIRPRISPSCERKIALGMGLFFDHVDTAALLENLEMPIQHTMSPAMFRHTLFEKARMDKKTIVLPESEDERILRAAEIVLRRGVADVVLLGNPEDITHRSGILGLDLSQANIIDPESSPLRQRFTDMFYEMRQDKGLHYPAAADAMAHGNYFGTMLVHTGMADGMVSGASHTTADTIRPALQIIKTVPRTDIVSSVFFMCLESRVLVYGDCAINQNPTASELAQIALSSAITARSFGIEPRIAMLSYSTGESGSGEEVDKVKEATRLVSQSDPSLPVDGPIQYDAAIDSDVAALKLPGSEVAGKATVFIFPDLNTGNNTYKAVQRSSGAIAIGPILQGLNRPINDLSRGCSVEDIVSTIAITAIQAQEKR